MHDAVTFLRIQFPPHTVVSTISKTMCWIMGSELPEAGSGLYEIYLDIITIYLLRKRFKNCKIWAKTFKFSQQLYFCIQINKIQKHSSIINCNLYWQIAVDNYYFSGFK